MATIKDLKFDDKNFNKHTQFGMSLIEKSLRENGAGRSILLDKDNNIIAGNGVVESAGQIGLEKIKIVETTGDEIVAVKRTDISLNSKKGREMALADNATASADLEWDEDAIDSESEKWGIDPSEWLGNEWGEEATEPEPENKEQDEVSRVLVASVTIYGQSKNDDSVMVREIPDELANKLLEATEKIGENAILDKIMEALQNV